MKLSGETRKVLAEIEESGRLVSPKDLIRLLGAAYDDGSNDTLLALADVFEKDLASVKCGSLGEVGRIIREVGPAVMAKVGPA